MKRALRIQFALALPIILGNVTAAVNELVSRFVLGRASLSALAASLPGSMLALVFTGVFVNTIGFATTLIAEAHGARDEIRERRTFAQALYLAAATVPVFLLAIPVGLVLLRFIGHEADVLRNESIYFSFSAVCGLLNVFITALGTYPSGRGHTRLPSGAALAGCLVDMIATPLLVLSADAGIIGAGLAKVLGALTQLSILLCSVIRPLRANTSGSALGHIDLGLCGRLLRLGLPFGLSSVVGSGTFTVFVLCLGACGAEALAVGNLCFALNNLFNTAQNAIESAVVITVGTCKGAGDRRGVQLGFYAGLVLSLAALLICYIPILLRSDDIAAFFLAGSETPSALGLVRFFLTVLFVSGIFETVKHTASGALRGLGRTDAILVAHIVTA